MKHAIKLFFTVFAGALFFSSCNNAGNENSKPDSTAAKMATTATDTTASPSMVATSPEQDFINFAVPANTKEIIWLKAGIAKGSKEIKDHAKMMLKDHEGLDEKVKAYLTAHSTITAPVVDTTNTVNINDKTGKDWDKAWADKMVADHSALLDVLHKAETTVKDDGLLAIIKPTIKTVESHLAMAKMVQKKN